MSSKRLPGKSLKTISNIPILEIIYKRLKKSKKTTQVIVATSNHVSDKKIIDFCISNNIDFYKGSLNNLLIRFLNCAEKVKKKSFFRILEENARRSKNRNTSNISCSCV